MNYKTVFDISEASHWLALSDSKSCVKDFIIPNKAYELMKVKDNLTNEEEYYIRGEDGHLSMYYMCHNGLLVIASEDDIN